MFTFIIPLVNNLLIRPKVTVLPVVIGALGTITKDQVKGLEEDFEITERVETTQTTVLLRSTTILRRVL